MFSVKASMIAAIIAFVLSFFTGLISGGGFLIVLLRALMFAAIFFALAAGFYILIRTFLPDFLQDEAQAPAQGEYNPLGVNVDISVGDESEENRARQVNSKESAPSGMDQTRENSYNTKEEQTNESQFSAPPQAERENSSVKKAQADTPPANAKAIRLAAEEDLKKKAFR